ncbi:MAG: ribonuclease J, partial [Candidatus Liptonbacteria bacterium]|nr:ribonuclease J [Candidatus Liptonbacteria bacterium]
MDEKNSQPKITPHSAPSSHRQRGSNPIFTAAVHKDTARMTEHAPHQSRGAFRAVPRGGMPPQRQSGERGGAPHSAGENSSRMMRPKRGGRHRNSGSASRRGNDRSALKGGGGSARGAGRRHGRRDMRQRGGRITERPSKEKSTLSIPAPAHNTVRVIPLGGVEEVGKNMTAFEIGNDIIIVDCGFQFSKEETPGIDYILPNTRYIEERKEKIRAVIITHGHLDHIGGIPYILPKLGNPPVYMRNLTMLMIQKRQEEFPQVAPPELRVIEKSARIKAGEL